MGSLMRHTAREFLQPNLVQPPTFQAFRFLPQAGRHPFHPALHGLALPGSHPKPLATLLQAGLPLRHQAFTQGLSTPALVHIALQQSQTGGAQSMAQFPGALTTSLLQLFLGLKQRLPALAILPQGQGQLDFGLALHEGAQGQEALQPLDRPPHATSSSKRRTVSV